MRVLAAEVRPLTVTVIAKLVPTPGLTINEMDVWLLTILTALYKVLCRVTLIKEGLVPKLVPVILTTPPTVSGVVTEVTVGGL